MSTVDAICIECHCDLIVSDLAYEESGGQVYCLDCRPIDLSKLLLREREAREAKYDGRRTDSTH